MATETVAKPIQQVTPIKPSAGSSRLISLDIFRGATIATMILVNNPGNWSAVYWPLEHAAWNGWTPTDLIFPFFLFIVGISIHLSFTARRERGASRSNLMRHAAWRAVVIYVIGLFLAGFPNFDFHTIRFAGVLARIAVVFLISSAVVLYTGKRVWAGITAGLLVGYWLLMTRVPGFDLTMDGNLAAWLDKKVMYNHLWVAHRFDPEGILSTLPAIATCLLGVFCGVWLKADNRKGREGTQRRIAGMLVAGAIGLALGKLWGLAFPINKNLWTSSYVLFTAGFALVIFGILHWLVEVRGATAAGGRRTTTLATGQGSPGEGAGAHNPKLDARPPRVPWWGRQFVWYGSNAIVVYAASSFAGVVSVRFHTTWNGQRVLWKTMLYERFFAPLASPYHASLLWALAYVLTFLILVWIMYRKAIFVKI